MCASSWCCLLCLECLDLSEWSDLDNNEDVVDNKPLSLSKPQSGEDDGNLGDCGLQTLHLLLHS